MQKQTALDTISEEARMMRLEALPPEIKEAYLEVTRYHRHLLERLAQR